VIRRAGGFGSTRRLESLFAKGALGPDVSASYGGALVVRKRVAWRYVPVRRLALYIEESFC
jgi:hypothetical protein